MGKRASTGLIIIAALGAFVMGCGSDDESSGDQTIKTSSLTKAQYLKRANQLCTEKNSARFAAVEEAAREKETQTTLGSAVLESLTMEIMLPRISSLSGELAALGAPKGDERAIEGVLKELDASVAAGEAEPKRFVEGGLFADVDDALADYGLLACRF